MALPHETQRRVRYLTLAGVPGLVVLGVSIFVFDGMIQLVLGLAAVGLSALSLLIVALLLRRLDMAEAELGRSKSALARADHTRRALITAASHDMLEPVRKVEAFGARLDDKYSRQIDEAGRLYLDRMLDGGRRLRILIDRLLVFARLDDVSLNRERQPIAAIVRDVEERLRAELDAVGGEIMIGQFPDMHVDGRMMRMLVSELIENAITYRAKERALHIEIQFERVECEGEIREKISVSDNGIGFDPKYSERIFGVLDRLHSRSEYEGAGLGLAIARKIAELHGGTLTASSLPDQGSVFALILPVQA